MARRTRAEGGVAKLAKSEKSSRSSPKHSAGDVAFDAGTSDQRAGHVDDRDRHLPPSVKYEVFTSR